MGRDRRSASPADLFKNDKESTETSTHLSVRKVDRAIQTLSAPISTTSSPLKRGDCMMDLDQDSLGSPVAKRRSLHGAAFGGDFNVFEHAPLSSRASEERNDGDQGTEGTGTQSALPAGTSPFFASMPKRSSSLRKSTLQQRYHDKPNFAQSKLNPALAFEFAGHGTANPKTKQHRMSLENFLPPMPRDSPFTSAGFLPNASIHTLPQSNAGRQGHNQPHPLSQTISQSSSASSIADDSPSHAPAKQVQQPTAPIDFSKSLPIGAIRPVARKSFSNDVQEELAGSTYVTPQNYRLVKPLPAAFMSTGLISKRNRNPAETLPGGVRNKAMPDTPCKRPALNFQSTPFPPKGTKVSPGQHGQESDGPFTPIHPQRPKLSIGSSGTGVGIFGSKFIEGSATRRGSLLNIDGDDNSHSPSGKSEDQQNEYDLPPTPTKQVHSLGGAPLSKQDNKGTSMFDRLRFGSKTVGRFSGFQLGLQASQEARSCKLPPLHIFFPGTAQGDGDHHTIQDSSNCSPLRLSSSSHTPSLHSFKHSRLLRKGPGGPSPSSLSLNPLDHLSSISFSPTACRSSLTKPGPCPPASPIDHLDLAQASSPRTPQETMMPPDPSGLSISGHGSAIQPNSIFPPATPTAGHNGRVTNMTPFGGFASNDVDVSLMARFDKVELIGTGVFSQVYRVTKRPDGTPFGTSSKSSATSLPEQVFAVKKSIKPYAGNRDRERKLQEVNILKALGRSDHVVHLVDDWEDRNHLYIQTEFCEEGSLDLFLTQVGRKARLDDFRIWKIMLELCLVGTTIVIMTLFLS